MGANRKYLLLIAIASVASAAGTTAKTPAPTPQQYRHSVMTKIARNWNPIRASKDVAIKLGFKIRANGSVSDVRILEHTEEKANELRAIAAVKNSAPFAPPPRSLGGSVDLTLTLECPEALHLTVAQALQRYRTEGRALLRGQCVAAGISYPPKRLTLVGLKDERLLLMFGGDQPLALLGAFPLVTFSGVLGPKLRQGDLQIPEGVYRVTGANAYDMLSLTLNYPNEFDRTNAASDRRTKLGGDILFHGGSVSTGCLVISNEQMQELFVAVNDVGFKNTRVIIAPCDLTKARPEVDYEKQPRWLPALYAMLKNELSQVRMPLVIPKP